jgi:unsaturated rhamnogalacturonyl hydrolase
VIGESRRSGRLAQMLEQAADVLVSFPFSCWHYGDSVGFEGLLAATKILGDPRYGAFAHGFMRAWSTRARPYRELDNTAPGHAICLVCERTGDEQLLEAARELARFLIQRSKIAGVYAAFEQAPLIEPYGGPALPADERALLADPGPGVFVDCMHFDAPFLVHLGVLTASRDLVDEGAEQALAAVNLLQDGRTGIFHHFYLARSERCYGYGWSRGQGWALLGLLDVLERLPERHPAADALARSLRALADALVATEDGSGRWPGLIDDSGAFLETSASAFFAAGLARGIRLGLLDPGMLQIADRAYDAGLDALGPDGVMRGVSQAIWACTSRAHYLAVPIGGAVPWGQGPLLLAATELEGMWDER